MAEDRITEGGCLCGALRVLARGEPLRVGICHCLDCRKHHGSPFQATAIYPAACVSIVGAYNSFRGRSFCPTCGGSVFARTGDEVELALGALDSPNQFRPSYELWTIRRESWLPDFAGMRTYTKNRDEDGGEV